MKRLSAVMSVVGAGALALAASGAQAQAMASARVLSSTPAYENVPVQQCAPGGYGGQPMGGGAALGALVGGLIGSQFGHGNGHVAGAVLGTLGGAFLGNAAEAQQRGTYGGCNTAYQQRLVGYDVTYEYGGRQYQTRVAQDPGPWLQVPVAGGYGDGYGAPVQTYPVAPPPVAAYPLPAYPAGGEAAGAVVTAPPGAGAYGYPPPAYAAPMYQAPVQAAPVVRAPYPAYVTPVGVSLSVGGAFGRHGRGGWGVSVGSGW